MTEIPSPTEPLAAGFPAADRARWEALVRVGAAGPGQPLVTALEDDIEVSWLYTAEDELAPDPGGVTGAAPFTRGVRLGVPWAIRQQNMTPDRVQANREILEDLEGGAGEILLVIASVSGPGIQLTGVDDLDEVLGDVHLDLAPVALAAGEATGPTAGWLLDLWRRRGYAPSELRGSLRLDPIGTLARAGHVSERRVLEETQAAIGMLGRVRREFPQVRVMAVDTTAYVEAGAGAVLELGVALATAIAYLRAAEEAGIEPRALAAGLEFTLTAGPDQFLEIAKLRAARRLWANALRHCGVAPPERRSAIHVHTSRRMVSALDPWVNLLRAASAAFAAAVAGADGITVLPFDEPVLAPGEPPGPLGRRMARNTQLVLLEEALLHRVADPAGGSWYVEALTDQLARAAWGEMQEIERRGGIAAALRSGEITRRVSEATGRRHDELARRRRWMTGVNMFPLLGDDGLQRAGVASEAQALEGVPEALPEGEMLPAVRDGAAFEALRTRALRIAAERGREPTILLACLGPLAAHVNVAQWAGSFFEAGGVRTVPSGVQPDSAAQAALLDAHGLTVVAVCAGPQAESGVQRELVAALRGGGARLVYVAAADREAARAAGADEGVRDGIDMVAALGQLLDRFEQGEL